MSVTEKWRISKKKVKKSDQKRGKNGAIFEVDFGVLTTFLTKNFVPKGVYRVLNAYDEIGEDVGKIRNGVYMEMVSSGIALMPYVCD